MRITKGVVVTIFSCKIDIKLFVGMIGFCALNWRKFKKVFKFQVIWVKQAIFNLIFDGFYVIRFQVTRQKSISVQSNKAIRPSLAQSLRVFAVIIKNKEVYIEIHLWGKRTDLYIVIKKLEKSSHQGDY